MLSKIRAFLKSGEGILLSILALAAGFLRFYRFNDFVTFLGDQGRDAIIIKRIVAFEHLPAIGPPTSVGQVYLGPFYYYFMSPWLWLSGFEPIGLAVGVSLISIASIVAAYFMLKDLFNQKVAFISTFILTFSAVFVEFSRFSWNPNLLPFFTLFFIYFLIKSLQKYDPGYFLLAGAFLAFSIQLHYLALLLAPVAAIYFLIRLLEEKKLVKTVLGGILFTFSFLLFSIPLVIFDLRHDFLNSKNFLKLFEGSGNISTRNIESLNSTFLEINRFLFNFEFNRILLSAVMVLILIALLSVVWKKNHIRTFLIFFLALLIGISLYSGPKFAHYLGILFLPYIVVVGYFLSTLLNNQFGRLLVTIFLAGFLILNAQGYYFFQNKGNFQIDKAKKVSKIIFDDVKTTKYQVTTLPYQYSDPHYRYFLEIWGKKPLEKDSLEKASVLYVVCESACIPIGDPQWDVAYFAATEVEKVWDVDNVKIYKLVH